VAPVNVTEKRNLWRAGFKPGAPLAEQRDRPFVPAWQIACVMGVSESTVYDSGKRFDAAMRAGDHESAAREVPCVLMGHSHRFPTDAFLSWWGSAGQVTLEKLTEAVA
jgi:hypothetical protein